MNFFTRWRIRRAVTRAVKTYDIWYNYPPHQVKTELKVINKSWCWKVSFQEDPSKRRSMRDVMRTMYGYYSLGLSGSGNVGNSVRTKQKAVTQSAYAEQLMNVALQEELLPKVSQYFFVTEG